MPIRSGRLVATLSRSASQPWVNKLLRGYDNLTNRPQSVRFCTDTVSFGTDRCASLKSFAAKRYPAHGAYELIVVSPLSRSASARPRLCLKAGLHRFFARILTKGQKGNEIAARVTRGGAQAATDPLANAGRSDERSCQTHLRWQPHTASGFTPPARVRPSRKTARRPGRNCFRQHSR